MTLQELETPAVLIDLDAMDRNIARMAAYAREHKLQLRPHVKTHKNIEIARQQIAAGACGITVAKPGEAEIMVEGGITDILIAYPIVDTHKARRVAELARRCAIRVGLDSEDALRCLAEAAGAAGVEIGILIEVDVGFGRCGVQNGSESAALARQASELGGLRVDGLMFYPGHIKVPAEQQDAPIAEVNARLRGHYQAWAQEGLAIRVVSGGSTPTAWRSHEFEGLTEIRPGMYPFLDRNMLSIGVGAVEDCAVSVLTTVVSNAVPGRAMVDGGSKTFSSDTFLQGGKGYGFVIDAPDAELIGFSEEHGHLDVSQCSRRLRVGERVRIIPNHVCVTVNLHDRVFGVRAGRVERELRVDARGRVQ